LRERHARARATGGDGTDDLRVGDDLRGGGLAAFGITAIILSLQGNRVSKHFTTHLQGDLNPAL
jgi:hypothetical protein